MLVLSGAITAQQQAGSIRGAVRDRDFDAPLPGAVVTILERKLKVTTSDQGNFVFEQVPPSRYTLSFAKPGYVRALRTDVVVNAGRLTEVNIELAGDYTDMEEFIVEDVLQLGAGTESGLLELRFDSPALMDSVGSELMSRAGASDAAGALRLVSGASLKDGKSAVIRGLPDRYVSSQMNGVRLPTADEDKRAVELDQFPAAVLDSIQVTKTFTPDQQGDASGGAVNVRLKGIPDEPFFFKIKGETSFNSQVTGRTDFLSYRGGGVSTWGSDSSRRIQTENLEGNWEGSVGVTTIDAPVDYKWSAAMGGSYELSKDIRIGGFASVFYERDSAFYDNGQDNSLWVEEPGRALTPRTLQGNVGDGDFKTALFDVTQGSQSVNWGGLGTFGVDLGQHEVNLVYLWTRTAEDKATLAEDTRGKEFFFPGHNPDDLSSPGHTSEDSAPYIRSETLEYTERTTRTLQFNGRHTLPTGDFWVFSDPEIDWVFAQSSATLDQPDKRQLGSKWQPERRVGPPSLGLSIPAFHSPFKPAAQTSLGALQRIFKRIDEDSQQLAFNLKAPFRNWGDDPGYLKLGYFIDKVERSFNQDTFSNFGDEGSFDAPFSTLWSAEFPNQNHPIFESEVDVDYEGDLRVEAYYAMVDLPLTSQLSLIGGARFETTKIGIVNDPEEDAKWFPQESLAETALNPGDADVAFDQDDVLPAIALIYEPIEGVTLRGSYAETVARQTFKELTPILQQEFLGGPIFIGNPDLQMSAVENYDFRIDYTPYEGSLLSASYFLKDIDDPIEYVQEIVTFDFTTAVNYPDGELEGFEFELRQHLGELWAGVSGLSIGGNATFIDSEVTLTDEEIEDFADPLINAPIQTRDATGAPERLLNLFLTWDIEATGTTLGLFYTRTGDTLLAGATAANGKLVPSIYQKESDLLNLSIAQEIGPFVNLVFKAKNITNPVIETVYRSGYVGPDVTESSFARGIEYSIGLGGEFRF